MDITPGATDVTTYFVLRLAADGTELTGATITNMDLVYTRSRAAAVKADATALAQVDSAHADNKAIEVDATNAPGLYRVDWPDAAFAAGVGEVILNVKYATAFVEFLRVSLVVPPPTAAEIATEVDVTSVLDENTADHDTAGTIGYSIGLLATGTGSYSGDPVVDGSANPIEGAIVSVHTDAACATDPVQVLVTDALGLYTVRRPAGTYYLFISAENFQSIVGKEITVA